MIDSCILANARSAKILAARSSAHADLTGEEFTAIVSRSRDFIVQSEILAGQMISPLRASLTNQVGRGEVRNFTRDTELPVQARSFLSAFHNQRLQAAAKHVEDEQWIQADIPGVTCHEIGNLVLSATKQPTKEPESGSSNENHQVDPIAVMSSSPAKSLDIEDQTFILVPATIKTLDMLISYMRLLVDLDSIATDVMAKIVEFLKASRSERKVSEQKGLITWI